MTLAIQMLHLAKATAVAGETTGSLRKPEMNAAIPDEKLTAISEALYGARKIEAIKIYRQHTGVSLYDAKQAVEQIEADLRTATPEKFSRAPGKGCLGVTVSMLAFSACAAWWLGSGLS